MKEVCRHVGRVKHRGIILGIKLQLLGTVAGSYLFQFLVFLEKTEGKVLVEEIGL